MRCIGNLFTWISFLCFASRLPNMANVALGSRRLIAVLLSHMNVTRALTAKYFGTDETNRRLHCVRMHVMNVIRQCMTIQKTKF